MYYLHPATKELISLEDGQIVRWQPVVDQKEFQQNVTQKATDDDVKTAHEIVDKVIKKRGRPAKQKEARSPKPCCGSMGPRHRATCSQKKLGSLDGLLPTDNKRKFAMTQKQFSSVKISQQHDLPPKTVAFELGVTIAEVERALLAQDYEEYSTRA